MYVKTAVLVKRLTFIGSDSSQSIKLRKMQFAHSQRLALCQELSRDVFLGEDPCF